MIPEILLHPTRVLLLPKIPLIYGQMLLTVTGLKDGFLGGKMKV